MNPAEPRVRLEGISHRFGSNQVIRDVSLDIAASELLTLLGPSGCGKTTLLRIIAGFERPSAGRVLIDGEDVTGLPPNKRPTNLVFQRPTLFPHLDVFSNVAFGLQVARIGRAEQRERVAEALALVRLEGYEKRRSHELSGGQMQRVALARALVNRPAVLLLDEPLSALDLKIRLEMEVELRRVHRETGATFVYVTHDQREAMALSDRLVVMDQGRVDQVGTPTEVYRCPASVFAAQFVGNANVLPVEVLESGAGEALLKLGSHTRRVNASDATPGPAWLVLRPEAVRVAGAMGANGTTDSLPGVVRDAAYRGTGFSYRIELAEIETHVKAETRGASEHQVDQPVSVAWDADACWLLPREAEETLAPAPIPAEDLGPASPAVSDSDQADRPKEETAG
jgi:ABC-type Fe3+/spermidine/putrescine transport system ATPase subunit